MTFNKEELVQAGADELQYMIEWFTRSEAEDMAERIFDVWDKAYGAFDSYEDYQRNQLDLFDYHGDLFDEREQLSV